MQFRKFGFYRLEPGSSITITVDDTSDSSAAVLPIANLAAVQPITNPADPAQIIFDLAAAAPPLDVAAAPPLDATAAPPLDATAAPPLDAAAAPPLDAAAAPPLDAAAAPPLDAGAAPPLDAAAAPVGVQITSAPAYKELEDSDESLDCDIFKFQ